MRGIVDRFEGEFIVVELENEEMINIEKSRAPLAKEGDILIIERESITMDEKETARRREKIEEKFNGLFE
ncbi:hypothetical protein DUF3006 [Gottschalkia acidurici 9a]|uniref:Uncharacterized protein n=1 Tax=Gottschalkia acidurici (strain ATCC 7906 / DSM 604 / BCRC 14475 / CIP 104303 / KCTC 5404 / NCIMB 10678 / 9a) TaxID=1128398 RepID=K0B0T6_GOTA9|nr:DUF3006 domain-containing protein [Gottschalkia acidurici]AFS78256.1 hypothetical protein DUF3006 [Gottschalkia acidurici 9a]